MLERVLLRRHAPMISTLLLEDSQRPVHVAVDECGVGPSLREKLARQRLDACAELGKIVGRSQMLTRIQRPHVPVAFGVRLIEVQQWCEHWQIPGQLRCSTGAQPLPLPVAPMAEPVDRADGADENHFANDPCNGEGMERVSRVIPTQRQGHHCAKHGNRADQIDCPESAPVAVSVVNGRSVEFSVLRLDRLDQWCEAFRRTHRRRRCAGFQAHSQQQQALNGLM